VRRSLIVGTVVTLVLLPIAAYAANQFKDVPTSNVFHDAIDWMKENKITIGCNPPANDKYCPGTPVTRGQMAAFMKRLAEYQVVDAGALGGSGPQAFKSRGGAVAIDTTFGQGTTSIGHMTGFTVPASGGALIATADVSLVLNNGSQLGAIYLEFDGTGACNSNPAVFGYFETSTGFDGSSTSLTKAVNEGDHRVDLCAGGLSVNTTDAIGSLTVEWVEQAEGGTTALAGTPSSLLSRLSDLANKLDLDADQTP
jgi:hypothetical protein